MNSGVKINSTILYLGYMNKKSLKRINRKIDKLFDNNIYLLKDNSYLILSNKDNNYTSIVMNKSNNNVYFTLINKVNIDLFRKLINESMYLKVRYTLLGWWSSINLVKTFPKYYKVYKVFDEFDKVLKLAELKSNYSPIYSEDEYQIESRKLSDKFEKYLINKQL